MRPECNQVPHQDVYCAYGTHHCTVTHSDELRRRDLLVACTECGAEVGERCSIEPLRHFSRRLRWLVEERRPDLIPPKS